jgi:ankyrin repeat protein
MFWAVLGDAENVRRLISRGASLDAVDDDGDTALYYAVSAGALGAMRVLLEHGANANICGANGSVLLLSAGRGWLDAMRLLIGAGADVDVRSSVGDTRRVTPLMVASGAGQDAAVRLLLDSGADRDLLDADGDTAEFYARSNGFAATADLLGTHPRRY